MVNPWLLSMLEVVAIIVLPWVLSLSSWLAPPLPTKILLHKSYSKPASANVCYWRSCCLTFPLAKEPSSQGSNEEFVENNEKTQYPQKEKKKKTHITTLTSSISMRHQMLI
jgi:hypothetical protein